MMRTQPIRGSNAPSITGYQSCKSVLRHRRGQIVADSLLVIKKLGGDDRTDGVTSMILGSAGATAVSIKSGDRVEAARLQFPTDDISIRHVSSIADVRLPLSQAEAFWCQI